MLAHKTKLLIIIIVAVCLSPLLSLINWGSFSSLNIGLVTDAGSIFDRSFNQSAWEGIKSINSRASQSLDAIQPLGHNPSELINAYSVHVAAKKKYVVASGFYHAAGIEDFNKEGYRDDMNFILLDATVDAPNVASVRYETAASGFLAANLSALYLNAQKEQGTIGYDKPQVGMWGGGNFPGVTDFMVGFVYGIKYFNEQNPEQKIGFAEFGEESQYTDSGFESGKGSDKAQYLLNQGAQVLMPVAGPQAADAFTEIQKTKLNNQKVIGVDSDAAIKFPNQKQYFITSILKDLTKTVVEIYNTISGHSSNPDFKGLGETTVGTISNGLTGIANNTDGEAWKNIDNAQQMYETSTSPQLIAAAIANVTGKTWQDALKAIKKL